MVLLLRNKLKPEHGLLNKPPLVLDKRVLPQGNKANGRGCWGSSLVLLGAMCMVGWVLDTALRPPGWLPRCKHTDVLVMAQVL